MKYTFCRIDTLGPIYIYQNDIEGTLKCLAKPYQIVDDKPAYDAIIESLSRGKYNILIFTNYTVIEIEKLRRLLFKYLERK